MQLEDAHHQIHLAEEHSALPDGWTVKFHVDSDASPIREDIRYDHDLKAARVSFNVEQYGSEAELHADIQDALADIRARIERHEV